MLVYVYMYICIYGLINTCIFVLTIPLKDNVWLNASNIVLIYTASYLSQNKLLNCILWLADTYSNSVKINDLKEYVLTRDHPQMLITTGKTHIR
jgi:hypothetical protein